MGNGDGIVILDLEDRVDGVFDPRADTGKERLVHPGHPCRSVLQALAARVFPDSLQNVGHSSFNAAFLDRDSLPTVPICESPALELSERHRLHRLEGRFNHRSLRRDAGYRQVGVFQSRPGKNANHPLVRKVQALPVHLD